MFIARQPIFTKDLTIFGYELLYRADINSSEFDGINSVSSTAAVFEGLFEEGIKKIVGKRAAFVNFDYDFLMSDNIELINPSTLVIEVLENVENNEEILRRVEYLKSAGYKIALDDFIENEKTIPFIPLADIIKFDIIQTPLDTIESEVKRALKEKKIILAEKIETYDEFYKAKNMGFNLFQGYFFSKPKIVSKTRKNSSSKAQFTRILSELNKEEPSFNELSRIVESDITLSYKLLRVVHNKETTETFTSIKKTLMIMGLKEIERWINIIMMQEFSKDKPMVVIKHALQRYKFGEFLAKNSILRGKENQVSIMCLFSLIDVLFEQTLEEALKDLFISDSVYNALVHNTGEFSNIFNLVLSYEKAEWDEASRYADMIGINKSIISNGYINALNWTSETLALF